MMAEEKFASLSSGLLARKGAAKPAMRRQGYMNPQGDVADDLGWNDMGYEPPRPIESNGSEVYDSEPPAIHQQIDRISEGFGIEQEAEDEFDELEEAPGLDGHAGLSAMDQDDEAADAGDAAAAEDHARAAKAAAPEPVEAEEQALRAPAAEIIPMRPAAPETAAEPAEEHVPARDKVAFTLRLDKQRHLKLRLASALENRSAQQLVTEALDTFFKAMPDLDRLTANSRDRH